MRLLLAILALMAMLANPLTVAAAQASCAHAQAASTASMDTSSSMATGATASNDDLSMPCCDHNGDGRQAPKDCAQACVTMFGAAVVPDLISLHPVIATPTPAVVARSPLPPAHPPTGLDPPPKLSA